MTTAIHPSELKLSSREQEILICISDGLSSREIASKLFISKYTVDSHRRNMLKKGGVKNSAELCLYEYLLR